MVVDSGVLLNSVFRGVRWSKDQGFLAAAGSGVIRIYVPAHVFPEVEGHLRPGSRWCKKRALVDVTPFRERWDRKYRPILRVVTINASDVRDERVERIAARDPSDGAFAALASLLAPCVALAEDPDITDHGLAASDWEPLALLAGTAAESAAPLVSVMFGSNVRVRLSVAAIGAVARSQWWPLALAAIAGGLYVLHRQEPITKERVARWMGAGARFIEPVVQYLETVYAEGEAAQRQLRAAAIIPVSNPAPPLHRLARLVAVTPRASTGTELTTLLAQEGLQVTRDRVLKALRYYAYFEQSRPHHWQIGHQGAVGAPVAQAGSP